jgi:hypothetical protein
MNQIKRPLVTATLRYQVTSVQFLTKARTVHQTELISVDYCVEFCYQVKHRTEKGAVRQHGAGWNICETKEERGPKLHLICACQPIYLGRP